MSEDSRFPYTYACDYIRSFAGANFSRSEASQLRQVIADVVGVKDEELAVRLAKLYISEEEIVSKIDIK